MRAAAAALVALLAASLPACSSRPAAGNGRGGENGAASPELLLTGVTLRHVDADGGRGTVDAERASYSLATRIVKAEGVVVRIPTAHGEAELFAPAAEWGTEQGRILLPGGAEGSLGNDFRARLSRGEVDLRSGRLRCAGEADLSGPGFTVAGTGLAWDLKGGSGSLAAPKARIAPSAVPGRG